jgi:hypothetical protein
VAGLKNKINKKGGAGVPWPQAAARLKKWTIAQKATQKQ